MKAAIATLAALAAIPIATPALAHPGHYAEAGGHSHWLAAGALALAFVIAAAALWCRRARVARRAANGAEEKA